MQENGPPKVEQLKMQKAPCLLQTQGFCHGTPFVAKDERFCESGRGFVSGLIVD
jgi:hypothetical protein